MSYNIGDKFVIEIDSRFNDGTGMENDLYRIKGFKSLVFDEYGLDKLERYKEEEIIEVGDVIVSPAENECVVTRVDSDGRIIATYRDGSGGYINNELLKSYKKTGKKIDILSVLNQLKGDD